MPGQPRPGSYDKMPENTDEERYNKMRNMAGSDAADAEAEGPFNAFHKGRPALDNALSGIISRGVAKQASDAANASSEGHFGPNQAP